MSQRYSDCPDFSHSGVSDPICRDIGLSRLCIPTKRDMKPGVQRAAAGFAAGVTVHDSVTLPSKPSDDFYSGYGSPTFVSQNPPPGGAAGDLC